MAEKTLIEWTDATWNPVGGCSIESPGCDDCYAMQLAGTRLKHHPLYAGTTDKVKGKPVFNGTMTAAPNDHSVWTWPLRWRGAKEPKLGAGQPSLIFVGDMSDLFHENRSEEDIDRVFIVMALAHQHIFQVLTKRPDRMREYLTRILGEPHFDTVKRIAAALPPRGTYKLLPEIIFPLPNVWFGFSAERQKEFDRRWPHVRDIAGMGCTVFCSYEPALGPLVLPDDFLALGGRAQLIAGGLSGKHARRPMHPDWARCVRDQCAAASVSFFFKQWGEWGPHGIYPRGDETIMDMHRVGKKRAGRLLDGVEHNGFPTHLRRAG